MVFEQSDVYFVGSTFLNFSQVGPDNGQGLLNVLVPGSPDCRVLPNGGGDGLIGVDGQNCPFQMYSISGAINILQSGGYTFCTTSAEG